MTKLKKITIKILIRDLLFKIYYFNEYVIFIFYMKGIFLDNIYTFAKITRKIHVINNFKINIFIEINVFTSKRTIINFVT